MSSLHYARLNGTPINIVGGSKVVTRVPCDTTLKAFTGLSSASKRRTNIMFARAYVSGVVAFNVIKPKLLSSLRRRGKTVGFLTGKSAPHRGVCCPRYLRNLGNGWYTFNTFNVPDILVRRVVAISKIAPARVRSIWGRSFEDCSRRPSMMLAYRALYMHHDDAHIKFTVQGYLGRTAPERRESYNLSKTWFSDLNQIADSFNESGTRLRRRGFSKRGYRTPMQSTGK